MKYYALQRSQIEIPSELSRLDSTKLGQFSSPYQIGYHPKRFTPGTASKFFVYVVQRKVDFIEGNEEEEEDEVINGKQLNGRSYKNQSSKVQILLSAETDTSIDPTLEKSSSTPSTPSQFENGFYQEEEEDEEREEFDIIEVREVIETMKHPVLIENNEQELLLNSVNYSMKVPRKYLKLIKLFQTEEGYKLNMIHLRFPRTQMMEAFILGLEFLVQDVKELSGNENMFELFAVSHILSLKNLEDRCAKEIIKTLDQRKVVLASHLASTFSNEKILRACYRWIGVNLVRKNLFPTFNDEFDALNGNEENISSKRLHFISNHCLSFDQVAISSKIFESVIQKFISEKARYYEPPNDSNAVELILLRTQKETGNPIYHLFNKATGELKLIAMFNPDFGEYIISSSRSLKNVHLDNDTYLGGVKCNLVGTVFTIFDFGTANAHSSYNYSVPQTELAIVSYGKSFLGWEPREFGAMVPKVLKTNSDNESRLFNLIEKGSTESFHIIRNKPPKWNEARNSYTLDFRGKVKKASKKNFILEIEADKKEVMMMGKIDVDKFHLHYYAPFNIITAFGIALSSFHKKFLVK